MSSALNPFNDARTAEAYESWYLAHAGMAHAEEAALVRTLQRAFPEATRLVEIGCGTGHFTRAFAAQGYRVTGVDAAWPMLKQARRLWAPACVQADACALPFAGATFDVSLYITTLEFLREPSLALSEARRVATHGLVLGVLNAWSLPGLKQWGQSRLAARHSPDVYRAAHFYSPHELVRRVRRTLGSGAHMHWETIPGHGAFGALIVLSARWGEEQPGVENRQVKGSLTAMDTL